MSRVVIPKVMLEATLRGLKEEVEFVNESGEVLGYFTPARVQWELEDPIPSVEELDRIANEPGGRTLTEIMRDLEKLAS